MKKEHSEIMNRLNYLSGISDTDYPFISLYLNVNSTHFLDQTEHNRIFLKNAIQENEKKYEGDKLKSFKQDIEKIQSFLKKDINKNAHGVAVFACSEQGIFETFQSIIPFENEFNCDYFPHLKQLAYQHDEYENALVIIMDSQSSKIFDVNIGKGMSIQAMSLTDVYKFHKQGGWAQKRFQRGIEQEKNWHYKETADYTTKLTDEGDYNNVIIIAQHDEAEQFIKYLPKRIKVKVIDINDLQMYENTNVILENVINDLFSKEKEREYDTVKEIINRAQSKDHCTLGIEDIIDLSRDGRIDTLAVMKDKTQHGYKCGECLFSSKDQLKVGCPQCNGGTKETELIEEIIKSTFKNGGKVELIDSETQAGEELSRHDGIGAKLRY